MKRHLFFWPYFLIIILLSGLFWLPFSQQHPVNAQNGAVLAVVPGQILLYLDGDTSAQAQVTVSNVVDLNAFDITLTYDENVAVISSWSHGGFLPEPTCFREINDPGYFRLACVKLFTGVSGSGVLINLAIEAVAAGTTMLEFSPAELVALGGQIIPAQLDHGNISVAFHSGSLTGTLFLQGRAARAGIPASLGLGTEFEQGPFSAFSTSALRNNLDFGQVPNDSYPFTTAQPGYLNLNQSINVGGGTLSLPPLRLLAGDVLGDDVVSTADLDAIRAAFGGVGAGLAADLNGDGRVDVRDLALAGGNLGLTAQEAYADWLP